MGPTITRGWLQPGENLPETGRTAIHRALLRLDRPFAVVDGPGGPAVADGGVATLASGPVPAGALPLLAWVPDLTPDRLGSPAFRATYGVRAAYVTGAMANGIASARIVTAMARAGMMGVFGAAGLSTARIAAAIDEIQAAVGDAPYGFNLIHSPNEPHQEQETVDLYLARGVRTVEAAAFMRLTPTVVQYRLTGLTRGPDGRVVARNRVLAKVSREEVAEPFLRPAPPALVARLRAEGRITADEAALAARVPMADDVTAEADSGGHTDNRPLSVLLPVLIGLRDRVAAELGLDHAVRVGAAGGLGCPEAVAAAFAMGADYVLTGTVNQACVESGTSDMVRELLAQASMPDVTMAPASDMFEGGVQVQVLKRGTAFAMRGNRLYAAWRNHDRWDDLPASERAEIERSILRRSFDEVWAECASFFGVRDPAQLTRAATDPKHKMALVFRWYLGLSSRWAIGGQVDRKLDSQVWCGPAIGAFNAWTRGTFLAEPGNRSVVVVAANLMAGACAATRARWLAAQGVDAGPLAGRWAPRPLHVE